LRDLYVRERTLHLYFSEISHLHGICQCVWSPFRQMDVEKVDRMQMSIRIAENISRSPGNQRFVT